MSRLPHIQTQGLIALQGEGRGDGHPLAKLCLLSPSSVHPPAEKPTLSAPTHQDTIICVGFDGVLALPFFALLDAFKVRCIVDIRLFPTLGKRGLRSESTHAHFREHNIEYFRVPALGNRFDLKFKDRPSVGFAHHLEYLKTCAVSLQWLREKIKTGPLLLLGCDEDHQESEQKNVLEALHWAHSGFDIRILSRDDFHREDACQRFESIALKVPPPPPPQAAKPPSKTAKSKARKKAPAPSAQTKLLDI